MFERLRLFLDRLGCDVMLILFIHFLDGTSFSEDIRYKKSWDWLINEGSAYCKSSLKKKTFSRALESKLQIQLELSKKSTKPSLGFRVLEVWPCCSLVPPLG